MGTTATDVNGPLFRFGQRLRRERGVSHLLLFGSRSTRSQQEDSDYDLIVVSSLFRNVEPSERARGLRRIWREVGGEGPLDLICVTPEELQEASRRVSLLAHVLPQAVDITA